LKNSARQPHAALLIEIIERQDSQTLSQYPAQSADISRLETGPMSYRAPDIDDPRCVVSSPQTRPECQMESSFAARIGWGGSQAGCYRNRDEQSAWHGNETRSNRSSIFASSCRIPKSL
jgi:hypothetical protein